MNPHQLAEQRVRLSAEYARLSDEMAVILSQKPTQWLQIRENAKSDKAADREWEASPMGIQEMQIRLKMKAIEKQTSSISSMLRVLEGEARNQY